MKTLPYGSWPSPISAEMVAQSALSLGQVAIDGDDVYWVEGRPLEGGRQVVVRWDGRDRTDCTPADFSVRTRINEYGGGAYAVCDGVVFFCHFGDQRVYRQEPGRAPEPLTPEGDMRFGDLRVDSARGRLIAVCEVGAGGEGESRHSLVAIGVDGGGVQELRSGADFCSSPALDPEGSRLAWIEWQHPSMPWDGTELWAAEMGADGRLRDAKQLAGSPDESIFQPSWSPRGELFFVSDRSDWWNLYRFSVGRIEAITNDAREYGLPQWNLGMSTYAFSGPDEIVCARVQRSKWELVAIDVRERTSRTIATPFTSISSVRAAGGRTAFCAASPKLTPRVVVRQGARLQVVREAASLEVEEAFLSAPRPVEFPTSGGEPAYALYYAPRNPNARGPAGQRPPLLVKCHGGPTAAASTTLSLSIQFWTSRGFAVLDVDYGGSTGYGRKYRRRLDGKWGVVDVEDCVNGARFCADNGLADRDRLLITGSSAGGFTVLSALVFHRVFRAGASYYGISDLERLLEDTHKFEARYLDRLIGSYPEEAAVYRERSPLHAAAQARAAVIFFQGLDDRVVPPNQTAAMVAALRASGVPVAYIGFPGEQHGFRRAETIIRALSAEVAFYRRILEIPDPDDEADIEIENLRPPEN